MSETATVLVKEVKALKSGTSGKGPWTVYGLLDESDEVFGTTFSDTVFNAAKPLEGQKVEVMYDTDVQGRKQIKAVKAADTNGSTPALGTGDYVKGQTAPADKESISRAVALKAAVALATHTIPSSATPSEMVNKKVGPLCHLFEVYLNTGKWAGNLRDEDIPFS